MSDEFDGASPILRWAGGKRRLVPYLDNLLPPRWNTYAEPMAGSAALFFHLAPKDALLSDINPELINFYRMLRNKTSALTRRLMSLRASRTLYYKMRNRKPRSAMERAVRFAYLNRLCWNGLHRVNREGDFNVPIGGRLPRKLWKASELYKAGKLLQRARLFNADFETAMSRLRRRDFVFIDPPYPRGALRGDWFNRYCKDTFTLKDHERLGSAVRRMDERGVLVMILLASDPSILRCYPRSLHRRSLISSKSLISGKASSRRVVREAVLTNYVV